MKKGKHEWHGKSYGKTYSAWKNMRARCKGYQSKQNKDYKDRGITFCERWNSFEAFFADMGEKPDGRTLDRIDNDAGYSPENCRWATPLEQIRNQRPLRANNKSGVRGVCFYKSRNVWLAYFAGKVILTSKSLEKAIEARRKAENEALSKAR